MTKFHNDTYVIHWFRRDLRLTDNHSLYKALISGKKAVPLFIFDSNILSKLSDPKDQRLSFIHQMLFEIEEQLKNLGSNLLIKFGDPQKIWQDLIEEFNIQEVHVGWDHVNLSTNW